MPDAAPLSTVIIKHVEDEELVINYQVFEDDKLADRVKRFGLKSGEFSQTRKGLLHTEKRSISSRDLGVVSSKSHTKILIRKNSDGDLVFDTKVEIKTFGLVCFLPVWRNSVRTNSIVLPRLIPDDQPVFQTKPVRRGFIIEHLDVEDESDVVMLNHNISLNPPYSISAWVYLNKTGPRPPPLSGTDPLPGGPTIIGRGREQIGKHGSYVLRVGNERLVFSTGDSAPGSFLQADTLFPLNSWVLVIITHQGKTAKLYQNGKLVGTHTLDSSEKRRTTPTTVGGWLQPNIPGRPLDPRVFDDVWQGSIAELTIYDRVLTSKECKTMYSEGISQRVHKPKALP